MYIFARRSFLSRECTGEYLQNSLLQAPSFRFPALEHEQFYFPFGVMVVVVVVVAGGSGVERISHPLTIGAVDGRPPLSRFTGAAWESIEGLSFQTTIVPSVGQQCR